MIVLKNEIAIKNRSFEKQLLRKKELLCRCNNSEEVWKFSFSESKAVPKKSQNMREGKLLFEKKSQIKLVIMFN